MENSCFSICSLNQFGIIILYSSYFWGPVKDQPWIRHSNHFRRNSR